MEEYIVYVLVDGEERIVSVNSSFFMQNTDGWVEIDRGSGEKYRLAQLRYFPKGLVDHETETLLYKLENGQPVERSLAERMADIEQTQTMEERLAQLEEENAYLKESLEMLLSGVTEDG